MAFGFNKDIGLYLPRVFTYSGQSKHSVYSQPTYNYTGTQIMTGVAFAEVYPNTAELFWINGGTVRTSNSSYYGDPDPGSANIFIWCHEFRLTNNGILSANAANGDDASSQQGGNGGCGASGGGGGAEDDDGDGTIRWGGNGGQGTSGNDGNGDSAPGSGGQGFGQTYTHSYGFGGSALPGSSSNNPVSGVNGAGAGGGGGYVSGSGAGGGGGGGAGLLCVIGNIFSGDGTGSLQAFGGLGGGEASSQENGQTGGNGVVWFAFRAKTYPGSPTIGAQTAKLYAIKQNGGLVAQSSWANTWNYL